MAHGDDFGLLRLQARSVRRYLDRDLLHQIIIVENPSPGKPIAWRDDLRRDYADLAHRVRFIHARELTEIPHYVSGWFAQQVLKLLVSTMVGTERYVLLDGKNHLVAPLGRDFLETASGGMTLPAMNYTDHDMRPYFEATLGYFGLDYRQHIGRFLPTTTPFTLPTQTVRDCVRHVQAKEGKPFVEAFIQGGFKLSEFFLFGAYLIASGERLTDRYDLSGRKCQTIWAATGTQDALRMIGQYDAEPLPVFAVHRKAIPRLDPAVQHALARLWTRRRLFPDQDSAMRFLANRS